jgi:hypothetical protein
MMSACESIDRYTHCAGDPGRAIQRKRRAQGV